jgi:hypothetical protein
MDRVTDDVLTLAAIAKFWSRAPGSVHTADEIFCRLVQAVWRGDLTVELPARREPRNGDYRYSLLRAVAGVRSHPGLLFVRPGEPVGPVEEMLADGTTLLDLTKRIAWVADGEEPDDTQAEAAFRTLASADIDDYDVAVVGPALLSLSVDRDALRRYCEGAKISPPKFWITTKSSRGTSAAKAKCIKWFVSLAKSGSKPDSKAALRKDALAKFPGLTADGFNAVWKAHAPTHWKRAGAPKKP